MQGYLFFLLTCQMLTVTLSDASSEENDNSAPIDNYVQQRPKQPIIPMKKLKFVLTPKPNVEELYTYNPKGKIMSRMTLMPHFKPRTEAITVATTLGSRKPIMKLRKFTINSRGNGKYDKVEKLTRNTTHVSNEAERTKRIDIDKLDDNVTKFHKNPITDIYLPGESRINMEKQSMYKIDTKAPDNQQKKRDTVIKPNADNVSSEEEEDRTEFIFLENKSKKEIVNDMLDITYQNFENIETTTGTSLMKKEQRVKRNKNIIEEENLPSTVSGYTYTGRDTRLYSNNYFKNINT